MCNVNSARLSGRCAMLRTPRCRSAYSEPLTVESLGATGELGAQYAEFRRHEVPALMPWRHQFLPQPPLFPLSFFSIWNVCMYVG